jgi:high-affinity nickel-transport protein
MRWTAAGLPVVAGLAGANAAAWVWAWSAFAGRPALLGTALLAWVFGLRHAVDADHIAAIDNVVRKLMAAGERPLNAGLFFSLGHSTVVILACVVAGGVFATPADPEVAHRLGGAAGTALSAAFLCVIALANLAVLRGVWRQFRRARCGLPPAGADALAGGGVLARLLRPMMRSVRRSWHMYPLGVLFGLGFDTATEVGLLAISASQAAQGLSPVQILVFPALFTAGMALIDTADSVLMAGAYGWAFVNPVRKLWYNLTVTGASVIVALVIGGIQALGLLADRFGLAGGVWDVVAGLNGDLADFGLAVIGIFAACWGVSAAIYRWKRLGELPSEP